MLAAFEDLGLTSLMETHQTSGSTMIVSLGYDASEGVLQISFRNGRIYDYYMVPENVFREFVAAASAGEFFLERVRSRYPYRIVRQAT